MDAHRNKVISKFLSFILRHKPETIGLTLNEHGWANVEELIRRSADGHAGFSREELEEIVATNDKQRFVFNEDHSLIRASQGHSIEVELNLKPAQPPALLYHGTVEQFLPLIQHEGLKKMERQHVHLSMDEHTAIKVGSRRGKPIILVIASSKMALEGFTFYLSDNGVWLTDHVPARFISFP